MMLALDSIAVRNWYSHVQMVVIRCSIVSGVDPLESNPVGPQTVACYCASPEHQCYTQRSLGPHQTLSKKELKGSNRLLNEGRLWVTNDYYQYHIIGMFLCTKISYALSLKLCPNHFHNILIFCNGVITWAILFSLKMHINFGVYDLLITYINPNSLHWLSFILGLFTKSLT